VTVWFIVRLSFNKYVSIDSILVVAVLSSYMGQTFPSDRKEFLHPCYDLKRFLIYHTGKSCKRNILNFFGTVVNNINDRQHCLFWLNSYCDEFRPYPSFITEYKTCLWLKLIRWVENCGFIKAFCQRGITQILLSRTSYKFGNHIYIGTCTCVTFRLQDNCEGFWW